jgi:RNA polymerase sigma-70 factor (ECF subfamily)
LNDALQALIPRDTADGDLIARAQAGDPDAFSSLVDQMAPRLLRQAMLLCGDAEQAADLAQETLIQAWKGLPRYRGQGAFFTWLCGILIHHHKSWLRRRLRRPGCEFNKSEPAELCALLTEEPATPDQNASMLERDLTLRRCLDRLPLKQRAVVYLRFYVDESLANIAAALDCSIGTVKSRLFHGLEKLSQMKELQSLSKDWHL